MNKKTSVIIGLFLLWVVRPVTSQELSEVQPLLTVKEVMNGIITPTTTTIWGAYQLETEAEWQEVENAALAVIGAGNLLALGGSGEGEILLSQEADWKASNDAMITAARAVIQAVEVRDEEALSEAGNNALYPPCESCHQKYQNQ